MWGLGFGAEACRLQGLRFCGMGSDGAQGFSCLRSFAKEGCLRVFNNFQYSRILNQSSHTSYFLDSFQRYGRIRPVQVLKYIIRAPNPKSQTLNRIGAHLRPNYAAFGYLDAQGPFMGNKSIRALIFLLHSY